MLRFSLLGAGHHVAHGSGVVAVLCEDRPIGVADLAHEALSKVDDGRRRAVGDVQQVALRVSGRGDPRVAVAGDHRAEGAHEVDVLVAIHVPQAAAVGPAVILRIAGRHFPIDRHVAVHAAGDHALGALSECCVVVHVPDPASLAGEVSASRVC